MYCGSPHARRRELAANYLNSTFCLAPGGSRSASEPGWGVRLLHAALYGCIPVIVQPNVSQALEEALDYSRFAITCAPTSSPFACRLRRRCGCPACPVPVSKRRTRVGQKLFQLGLRQKALDADAARCRGAADPCTTANISHGVWGQPGGSASERDVVRALQGVDRGHSEPTVHPASRPPAHPRTHAGARSLLLLQLKSHVSAGPQRCA